MAARNFKKSGFKKNARILIVDDQPLMRHGLGELLGGQPGLRVCGAVGDWQQALAAIAKTAPHLVTVEVLIKNFSGLELIKEIHRRFPRVLILVVSNQDGILYAERALRAGALGFVHKQEPLANIVKAVRTVLRQKVYVSEPITSKLAAKIVGRPHRSTTIVDRLTDRELQIFGLTGDGLGPNQIGARLNINKSTVETYRARIKKKLRFANATEMRQEAIAWKYSRGA